ncbi:hypothetical protein M2475_001649 [Breznakia sp. PF5-3]|nr:hypothetical protein [Breznakia sp. PM6-1]MDF9836073.1 hypothetical protein [Breznakia sp. PF5-3]MDF9838292.1 hypothetical protein [Breznakia sp. PFB2-8]MDF9860312.1 hypothetical protein [Breznakia sp. PH5-24]
MNIKVASIIGGALGLTLGIVIVKKVRKKGK